jgi:hypothetical protein
MKWIICLLSVIPFSLGKIRGSSLFGLETPLQNTDCSWVQPASYYIDELGKRGFNYLRIPFSGEYVRNNNFRVMDEIFEGASRWNMSICLDWHRNINGFQDNWLENISLDEYYRLYEILIERYKQKPTLKMIGLFNEFKGNEASFWQQQMGQVVLHFENKYPMRFDWLVGCPRWSGDCIDMDWSNYPFKDRIFVDHHKYIFSEPSNPQGWEKSFYKDHKQVIVGEWGYFSDSQSQWAETFVDWLIKNDIRNSFFWVSVSSSGDTGGLWKDCRVFEESKYQLLKRLWGVDDHRGLVEDKIFRGSNRVDNLLGFISNSSADAIVMDEAGDDDDWEDRNLQGPWRRRKCHFIEQPLMCIKHHVCCWGKAHDGCFKCA